MSNESDFILPPINPNLKTITVRNVVARNQASARTVMEVRGHQMVTDEPDAGDSGPTPLEMLLGSLMGCEGVIINRCATGLRFKYTAVEMEASSEIDPRGSRGVRGVRPHFSKVTLKIKMFSDESEERLQKLADTVESRCPVYNLLTAADVETVVHWSLAPASSA